MTKNKFRKSLFISGITTFSLFVVSGCEKNQDDWEITSDKCVFIEHFSHTDSELIEGNYREGPGYDVPTFSFDSVTGVLSGHINFQINKSLKLIFGNGRSSGGVAGTGVSTMLSGIYKLPFENDNLKITNVEVDGTIHLLYNDSTIVLKRNEEWIKIKSVIDTQNNAGEMAKAKLTLTDRIVNYGIIEKSTIIKE
jgi:hypothetical protein